jgi:hypothetical protein
MNLPIDSVVHGLMKELGLTVDEATTAAFDALDRTTPTQHIAPAVLDESIRCGN